MAGIGFALRRLSNEENLLSRAASMGHAAVVAAGPWLFTILSLGLITITTEPVAGLQTLETFRCAVIYAFAISLVTTSPVAIVTTRLVADGLYQRKFASIAGVYIGSLSAATLPVVAAVVMIYAGVLKIPLPLGIAGVHALAAQGIAQPRHGQSVKTITTKAPGTVLTFIVMIPGVGMHTGGQDIDPGATPFTV